MATQRTSIIRGPGSLKYGNVTFYDADGITAEVNTDTVGQ